MKIYINDIPVQIKEKNAEDNSRFDMILSEEDDLHLLTKLKGKILIKDTSIESIDQLLRIMTEKKHKKIKKIEIRVENKKQAERYLKGKFTVIEAAGGIAEKEDKILLILRNDLWDIPKGKLEANEDIEEAALREVEEETGVAVALNERICTTWHTYIRNKKYVLKKTYWYRMQCIDDSKLAPQKEENIQKAVWMNESEVDLALHHSYKTIGRVIKKYIKLKKSL
jgi:ADP-ribose pyrophosphatase YjhB (NUDIX family)